MAALAADPFRKVGGISLRRAVGIGPGGHVGIGGVAEEALAAHPPQHAVMVWPVEAGSHPPAPRLRVPGEGELIDLSSRGLVEVGAGMVAGAEDPVHRLLED